MRYFVRKSKIRLNNNDFVRNSYLGGESDTKWPGVKKAPGHFGKIVSGSGTETASDVMAMHGGFREASGLQVVPVEISIESSRQLLLRGGYCFPRE